MPLVSAYGWEVVFPQFDGFPTVNQYQESPRPLRKSEGIRQYSAWHTGGTQNYNVLLISLGQFLVKGHVSPIAIPSKLPELTLCRWLLNTRWLPAAKRTQSRFHFSLLVFICVLHPENIKFPEYIVTEELDCLPMADGA